MKLVQLAQKYPAIKGRKELICIGEEAEVFRITSTKNAFFRRYIESGGLVERVQKKPQNALIRMHARRDVIHEGSRQFKSRTCSFHFPCSQVLHYYMLHLANAIFPEYFPKIHTVRFSSGSVATYSQFIPDKSGVIERRQRAVQEFYAQDTSAGQHTVRIKHDDAEHGRCPALAQTVEKINAAGFEIPHPEANYHLADGTPVFLR